MAWRRLIYPSITLTAQQYKKIEISPVFLAPTIVYDYILICMFHSVFFYKHSTVSDRKNPKNSRDDDNKTAAIKIKACVVFRVIIDNLCQPRPERRHQTFLTPRWHLIYGDIRPWPIWILKLKRLELRMGLNHDPVQIKDLKKRPGESDNFRGSDAWYDD